MRSASLHPAPASLPGLTLPTHALAILALIAVNVIWGTTFVATKPVLAHIPPLTLASIRFAIALAVLLPFFRLTGRRPILSRAAALMGFVGIFLVYACQNLGLTMTGATNGAIIHAAIPVLTVVLAAPTLGERIDRRRVAGVALSFAGVAAVVLRGRQLGLSALGDGLVLLSALGLAAYIVLGRRAFPAGATLELAAGVMTFGLLFLMPVSAIELATVGMSRPTAVDALSLAWLGVAASGLAFLLWGYGLRHVEAGQAAAFANLNALVGVAFAWLLLGEAISPLQVAGGAAIIAGVWLATTSRARAWTPVPRLVQPAPDADAAFA